MKNAHAKIAPAQGLSKISDRKRACSLAREVSRSISKQGCVTVMTTRLFADGVCVLQLRTAFLGASPFRQVLTSHNQTLAFYEGVKL